MTKENQEQEEVPKPLTRQEYPNMSQLEIDVANVMEGFVDIQTFSPEYQQQIRNFYRFSPLNKGSNLNANQGGRSSWK